MEVITNSPGKCLISGGYLILNKNKKGIVLNVNSYIKTKSKIIDNIDNNNINELNINVKSIYFKQEFNYNICCENNQIKIKNNFNENDEINNNKWIYYSILISFYIYFLYDNKILEYFIKNKKSISLIIESDYKFYSYDKNNNNLNIKTGLGSSSALISSICSNVIILLNNIYNKNNINNNNINNLENNIKSLILISSIYSNNFIQNKIGSNFDIISCLTGNQIFQQIKININFDNFLINESNINHLNYLLKYFNIDYKISYLKNLNKIFNFCLISIENGSNTRKFVKKILEYANLNKKKDLFDDNLFSNLDKINNEIIKCFEENNFINLKLLCLEYRKILQKISLESNVEIEPKIFNILLDNLLKYKEIIYAICPGAGGYDSIVVMGENNNNNYEDFIKIVKINIEEFNNNNNNNNLKCHLIECNLINNGSLFSINY